MAMEFPSDVPAHSSFWVKYWILSLDDDQPSTLKEVAGSFTSISESINYAWNWEIPHVEFLKAGSIDFLFGSTRTYSSLGDEHTILWILRELTKKHINIAVRIIDEYGEFVLSMAEDAAGFSMPSWMSEPAYMAGKVWLKSGRWTFLKPMGSKRPQTTLEDARNALKGDTSKYSTMTYKSVDMGVDVTLEEYPLKHGNATKARVVLPDKWAKFFKDHHIFGIAIHERDHIIPGMKAAKESENCANIILDDDDTTHLIKPEGTQKMVLCTVTFSRNRFIEVLHTGEDILSEEANPETVLHRGVAAFLTPLMASTFYHSFDNTDSSIPWSKVTDMELDYFMDNVMPLFSAEPGSTKGQIEELLRKSFEPVIKEVTDYRVKLSETKYVSLDEVTLSSWDSFQEDTDAWMAEILQAEAGQDLNGNDEDMEQRLQNLMERVVGVDGIDDIVNPNASKGDEESDSDDESDEENHSTKYSESGKKNNEDEASYMGDSYNQENQFFSDEMAAGVGMDGNDLGDIDEDDFFEYFLTNALNLSPEQIEQMRSGKVENHETTDVAAKAEDEELSQQLIEQLMNLELEEHGIVDTSADVSDQLRESLELAPDRFNNPTAALLRGAGVPVPKEAKKK